MVDRTNVAALIPAHCEAAYIRGVVAGVRAQIDYVLVVDDGSSDGTAAEAQAGGADVLQHPVNRGKGAAIKSGLRKIQESGDWRYVLILDGDGQHRPDEIPRFLEEANRAGASMILGNRMGEAHRMPLVRRLTNRFMSWRISHLCRQEIPDSQCGFRMIRMDLVPTFFCESNNYDYETEILVIAAIRGCRISSIPVSTVYAGQKSKIHPLRDTLRFIRLMRRCRRAIRDRAVPASESGRNRSV